jgi:ATP-dependent RNA helicase DeaD
MNTEPNESSENSPPPAPEEAIPPPAWDTLGLSDVMLSAIGERGYEFPTPVQAESIPVGITGRDLIVRSKTGTGKTAAFMIPAIERIPAGYGKAAVMVLCPTRELAIQIAEESELLAKGKNLRVVSLYGGVKLGPQEDALLAGAEIIVGTPGRVQDHIRRGNLKLGEAMIGVLDEADEMLSMGFYQEVTNILSELPTGSQIFLFSASIEERLKELIGRFLNEPHEIYLSLDTDQTADTVDHVLYETSMEYPKPRQLLHVIEVENPTSAIIFCNTRSDTDMVARFLNRQGLVAEPISSDLTQAARERVMARIKRAEIDYLVATDIAARGIDISDLSHVFNYSLPEDPAIYLHRTGRTGRIGKKGTAISFMGGRELATRNVLQKKYEIDFDVRTLPTREEAEKLWTERHIGEMQHAVNEGLAFEGFLGMARDLRSRGPQADALIAIALRGFFRWHRAEVSRKALEAAGEDPEAVAEMMNQRNRRGGSGGGGRSGGHGRSGGGGHRGGGGRGRSGGGGGRRRS